MIRPRRAHGARFLARCVLFAAALAARSGCALAADAGQMHFDIPELPLVEALQRFAQRTGHSGLYDSRLAAGRRSREVSGEYTPEAALRLMLAGSGLQARYGSVDTFFIAAADEAGGSPSVAGAQEALAARQRFYGRLQAAMRVLLCQDEAIRPGHYRAAISLWFGTTGQVERVRLLDSTGSADRDTLLRQRLGMLRVGEPVPSSMRQPITFVIRPDSPMLAGDCLA